MYLVNIIKEVIKLKYKVELLDGSIKIIDREYMPLIAMGFTARNQEQMRKNLKALEDAGISIPDSFPQIYPCQNYLLSQDEEIEVVSDMTCGEVEFVILKTTEGIFIGVGSDHADKEVEKESIINSKQLCAKPFTNHFWDYDEIKNHWDNIILRSEQREVEKGELVKYQDNTVANILHPDTVLKAIEDKYGEDYEAIIFSGSVANVTGRFIYGVEFKYEIEDPICNRKINGKYKIKNIYKLGEN